MQHALHVELAARPILSNDRLLHDYLRAEMAFRTAEQVRVLYLTGHNHLIRDEVTAEGTLDEAWAYPREVIHRALELGAAKLILVHNHPAGDPTPSEGDRKMTRRLSDVAKGLNLLVVDHVIVGRDKCFSMLAHGLMY